MLHLFVRSFWLSLSLIIVGFLMFVVVSDYTKFSSSMLTIFESKQALFLTVQDMIALVLVGTVIVFVLSLFSGCQCHSSMAAKEPQDTKAIV
jgi:hypothetical protein